MSMSDTAERQAARIVTAFEGWSPTPYRDPVGVWTIGYGSIWDYRLAPVGRVGAATPAIDQATARLFVLTELHQAALAVAHDVHVPLTDKMRAALEDFVFNLGAGSLAASTLLRLLNAGDYAGAAAQFDQWDHAGGKELAGLLRRREVEAALFADPHATFQGALA